MGANGEHQSMTGPFAGLPLNPLGKLPGSVWTIATEPLRVPDHLGVDHFATFPMEWPRRIVTGWSPRGVCVDCGEGRRPVVRETGRIVASSGSPLLGGEGEKYGGLPLDSNKPIRTATGWSLPKAEKVLDGYACDCPEPTAPTTPGVVLDPFGGTGTTALVADALGRHGISVDMSADYCRLAEWRTSDPKQRAKAAQKPSTPPAEQIDGQVSLLDLIEEVSVSTAATHVGSRQSQTRPVPQPEPWQLSTSRRQSAQTAAGSSLGLASVEDDASGRDAVGVTPLGQDASGSVSTRGDVVEGHAPVGHGTGDLDAQDVLGVVGGVDGGGGVGVHGSKVTQRIYAAQPPSPTFSRR